MLIGICGPSHSGKNEVARYLVFQGFTRLYVRSKETAESHLPPDEAGGKNSKISSSLSTTGIEFHADNIGLSDHADSDTDSDSAGPAASQSPVVKHLQMDRNGETLGPASTMRDAVDIMYSKCDVEPSYVVFDSVADLLDFVTKRWREKFVTTNIHTVETVEVLSPRPFFLLIAVQSPTMVRYHRYRIKRKLLGDEPMSLEAFTAKSDYDLYRSSNALAPLMYKSRLQILNATQSIELLYVKLSNLNLCDESRLRPSWDAYFMELANLAARRSNCMKRRVGCVLVRENRVIATGYNGTPRGVKNCNEGGCTRCNSGGLDGSNLGTCLCLHAEENALMEAGRERIADESVLYCNTCPCLTCSIKIVQMGLKEVVYSRSYSMDDKSFSVLREGGITLRQYSPPEEGVVSI
ncbi:cytidine deaminase-like protein [Lipomyces kononenkoae]|uniref:Cytidine deaminase-like protein n=1 Tax=Lipomyces kononenkoae TaxID=34357 RepID=A0ACC3T0Y3_LIPKO